MTPVKAKSICLQPERSILTSYSISHQSIFKMSIQLALKQNLHEIPLVSLPPGFIDSTLLVIHAELGPLSSMV